MKRLLRALAPLAVYGVALIFTVSTGVILFWGTDSLWPLVYVLGLPLAATLYVDRRFFR